MKKQSNPPPPNIECKPEPPPSPPHKEMLDRGINRFCNCEDWNISMCQIVNAQRLAHNHGMKYTGKEFKFCPWCGRELFNIGTL